MATLKISTSVSKLGVSIPTVNLPPVVTCRPNAPCIKGCYAMKGHFIYKNVKNRLFENLEAYKEDPDLFFKTIEIAALSAKYFRYHSSGDIVDYNYLAGMCKVARKAKDCQFLCFTKKFELINQYVDDGHIIPKNLHIVFSCWKEFIPDNPHKFPTTWVYFPKDEQYNELIPKDSIPCTGKCYECHACWQLKKGQSVMFKKH